MKHAIITTIIFLIVVVLGINYMVIHRTDTVDEVEVPEERTDLGVDPMNTEYVVDDVRIVLEEGSSEVEVPNSSSRIITRIFGEPVLGDVNGDGKDDALVLLTQDTGGSGLFYYAAVAIASESGFVGSDAVFVGDRIAPQTLEVTHGVMIVNYADRNAGEPFSVSPSQARSVYFTYTSDQLLRVDQFLEGEMVMYGNVVMGHEVREFVPCGESQPQYWVSGDSPAYQELMDEYKVIEEGVNPYAPLFVAFVGKVVDAPEDGFGADYDYAVEVSQIVRVNQVGNCKDDLLVVQTPFAGGTVESPLRISGIARGTWFFEASFPISIVDWDGKIIGEGYATAQGDWMTTSFVPFEATIEFDTPTTYDRGVIIFKKDNPSGLPEHDDAYEMPVRFSTILETSG